MKTSNPSTLADEPRYIVVQRHPRHALHRAYWRGGIWLTGFIVGILVGYPWGYHRIQSANVEADQLEETLEETDAQVESMRGELAVHKHGSEVERLVSEHLRQEIVDLQNRLHEREQTITFYKNILDPQKNQGLAVHALELSRTPVAGRYAFKLVLVQPLDSGNEISGAAIISVSGVQSGKPTQLEWKSLGEGKPAPAYKFKVFQDITGEFRLPDAFIPEKISVRLGRAGSKSGETVEYPWTLKETP